MKCIGGFLLPFVSDNNYFDLSELLTMRNHHLLQIILNEHIHLDRELNQNIDGLTLIGPFGF